MSPTSDARTPNFISQSGLGDGKIDNFIIDTSLHLATGMLVLACLTSAVILLGLDAYKNRAITRWTRISILASQIALTLQLLLGLKLLDQGQGISQLYIHYVGGLLPLGTFLVGGWFVRGDNGRSTRILAALITVGLLSAAMAFFIGRAYVNR